MSTKPREIRTKNDFTLPCPDCDAECEAVELAKPKQRKEVTTAGAVVVLPKREVYLHCEQCNLQLWTALDEDGNPLDFT